MVNEASFGVSAYYQKTRIYRFMMILTRHAHFGTVKLSIFTRLCGNFLILTFVSNTGLCSADNQKFLLLQIFFFSNFVSFMSYERTNVCPDDKRLRVFGV